MGHVTVITCLLVAAYCGVEAVKYPLFGQWSTSEVLDNSCLNQSSWNITIKPDPDKKLKGRPYTQFYRGNPLCEPVLTTIDTDGEPIYTFSFDPTLQDCGIRHGGNGTYTVTVILPFRTDGIEVREDHILLLTCGSKDPVWFYNETVGVLDPRWTDFNPNKTDEMEYVPPEIVVSVWRNGAPLVPGAPAYLGETLTMRIEVIDPSGIFTKVKVQNLWATHENNPAAGQNLGMVEGGCSSENIPGEAGVPVFENFKQVSAPSVIESDFRVFRFAGKPDVHLFMTTTSCTRSEELECEMGVNTVTREPCPEPPTTAPPTTEPPPTTTRQPTTPPPSRQPTTLPPIHPATPPPETPPPHTPPPETPPPPTPPPPTPPLLPTEPGLGEGEYFEGSGDEYYNHSAISRPPTSTMPAPTSTHRPSTSTPTDVKGSASKEAGKGNFDEFYYTSIFSHTLRKRSLQSGETREVPNVISAYSHQVKVGHILLLPSSTRIKRDVEDDLSEYEEQKNLEDEPLAVSGMTSFYFSVYNNPQEVPNEKDNPKIELETGYGVVDKGLSDLPLEKLGHLCLSVMGTASLSALGGAALVLMISLAGCLTRKIRNVQMSLADSTRSDGHHNQPRDHPNFYTEHRHYRNSYPDYRWEK